MDFAATARKLQEKGITNREIGEALGVAESTARAYRLDPSSEGHRRPPEDWRPKLAKLARSRGVELTDLGAEIERGRAVRGHGYDLAFANGLKRELDFANEVAEAHRTALAQMQAAADLSRFRDSIAETQRVSDTFRDAMLSTGVAKTLERFREQQDAALGAVADRFRELAMGTQALHEGFASAASAVTLLAESFQIGQLSEMVSRMDWVTSAGVSPRAFSALSTELSSAAESAPESVDLGKTLSKESVSTLQIIMFLVNLLYTLMLSKSTDGNTDETVWAALLALGAPDGMAWVGEVTTPVPLRTGRTVEAANVGGIPAGTRVLVLRESEGWALVEFLNDSADMVVGWIEAEFLRHVSDD